MDTIYKTLNGFRPATADTTYRYPGVGSWTRHLDPDELALCRYGYHYVEGSQVLDWLASTIYEASPCPEHEPLSRGGKAVTCRLRLVRRFDGWTPRSAALFAADCAEHVLPLFEALFPDDVRPRDAIVAVRRFVDGEIAAAALDAAGDAARDAARDARDAAWAARDAEVAAGDAEASAEGAARAVTYATWAATAIRATWATTAARDAAVAARDAAGDADVAASDAAGATDVAEKTWQYQRLTEYLKGTS